MYMTSDRGLRKKMEAFLGIAVSHDHETEAQINIGVLSLIVIYFYTDFVFAVYAGPLFFIKVKWGRNSLKSLTFF